MVNVKTYGILILLFLASLMKAQQEPFEVSKLPFSSDKYDEYAPLIYDESMVYCSNKKQNLLLSYKSIDNHLPLNIYRIEMKDTGVWERSNMFGPKFSSNFNDGPLSIASNNSVLVYSRNTNTGIKLKNQLETSNTLGLFISYKKNDKWSDPVAFVFNSSDYSITTPALNKSGSYMVFASDMPGGYGGMDLYISYKREDGWGKPENLGKPINTSKSDAYPFINAYDDLVFSSDGHGGHGGKDLLLAKKNGNTWGNPKVLEAPLNSKYDDFSFYADSYFEEGYFASNREGTDDLYKFKSRIYPFSKCTAQKENKYCYQFYDENASELTTPYARYEWEFSDGVRQKGIKVNHCFNGPGHYSVKLHIVDEETGNVFFTNTAFQFELEKYVQPYIEAVPATIVGEEVVLDALSTNMPDVNVKKYYWQLGDKSLSTEFRLKHVYGKAGKYQIQLGIIGKDSLGHRVEACVKKELGVFDTWHDLLADMDYPSLFEKNKLNDPVYAKFAKLSSGNYALFGFNYSQIRSPQRRNISLMFKRINFKTINLRDKVLGQEQCEELNELLDSVSNWENVKLKLYVHSNEGDQNKLITDIAHLKEYCDIKGLKPSKLEIEACGHEYPIVNIKGAFENRIELILIPDVKVQNDEVEEP